MTTTPPARPSRPDPSGPATPGGAPAFVSHSTGSPRTGQARDPDAAPPADQPAHGGRGAVANAAAQQARQRVPYADKAAQAKQVADAAREGGLGAGAEQAAGMAGATAARAGVSALTGGASDAAGAVAPQVTRAVEKVGEKAGKVAYKGVATVATAAVLVIALVVTALGGGFTAILSSLSGSPTPPAPTRDQCESMPQGWCEVAYAAQRATHGKRTVVPWTVIAAIARVTTDYGRTSPYDLIDRDPERPVPPYLAANFSLSDTGVGGVGGTVPYNSGSLRWGGHENGRIPDAALCPIPFAPGHRLECTAAAALVQLNEAYKAEHGRDLGLTSSYRDYAGQVYQRERWCSRGQCGNAAQPGTSNHGWGKAVDFAGFGSLGVYTDPDYVWMASNGPRFGWVHPETMGPGGRGPHEPWHFEFRGTPTPRATAAGTVVPGTGAWAGSCAVAPPSTPIGGTGRQASGPFLLPPAVAAELTDEGGDPQDPCDAATFVARKLSAAGDRIAADRGRPALDDQDGAATFWQAVIEQAGVVADPTVPSGDCAQVGSGLPVDLMIERIWACEAASYPELHVVSGVRRTPIGIQFTEYSRSAAVDALIAEAKAVAWGASQYGQAACDTAADTAGVFPLTAQEAADAGLVDRCDPAGNIAAAARIVLSGETSKVWERDTTAGAFAPMLGGWSGIAAALGPDLDRFTAAGPPGSWEPPGICYPALEEYVLSVAAPGSALAELAGADQMPEDTTAYTQAAGAWPDSVRTACTGGSEADWAAAASTVAAGLLGTGGISPTRSGHDQDPAAPEPVGGEIDVDSVPPEAVGAGPGTSVPLTGPDPAALAGAAVWFSWVAAQQSATPAEPAVAGQHSLVLRLSPTGHVPAIGPVSVQPVTPSAWTVRVTEWALFYGGLVRPFDTFGTRTGSLLASLTGTGGTYGALAADAATQAQVVISAAKAYLGTPYSWGGGGPTGPSAGTSGIVGFDCSGLTEYAFAQAGYQIGGWTGAQKDQGTPVASLGEAQPGDLLFFGSPIRHVAIYLGDNQLIHAPKPGDVVKIAPVYEPPTSIRRVIQSRQTAGDVDGWIAAALQVLYADTSFPRRDDDAASLRTIIDHESSGNPAAVNMTDANWVAGHPSFGLMQTIPSTFEAYKHPGYPDRNDPVAQILAGARYAVARYGSLDQVPGVRAVAEGRPYVGY